MDPRSIPREQCYFIDPTNSSTILFLSHFIYNLSLKNIRSFERDVLFSTEYIQDMNFLKELPPEVKYISLTHTVKYIPNNTEKHRFQFHIYDPNSLTVIGILSPYGFNMLSYKKVEPLQIALDQLTDAQSRLLNYYLQQMGNINFFPATVPLNLPLNAPSAIHQLRGDAVQIILSHAMIKRMRQHVLGEICYDLYLPNNTVGIGAFGKGLASAGTIHFKNDGSFVYKADKARFGKLLTQQHDEDNIAFENRVFNEYQIGSRIWPLHLKSPVFFSLNGQLNALLTMRYFGMSDLRVLLMQDKKDLYDNQNNIPTLYRLKIGRRLILGLWQAHRQNIIHRDGKPENCLFIDCEPDFYAFYIDYGLATSKENDDKKLYVGSPSYAAPEAWEGKPITQESDYYGLAWMLFELCGGQAALDCYAPIVRKDVLDNATDEEKLNPSALEKAINDELLERLKKEASCLDFKKVAAEFGFLTGITDVDRKTAEEMLQAFNNLARHTSPESLLNILELYDKWILEIKIKEPDFLEDKIRAYTAGILFRNAFYHQDFIAENAFVDITPKAQKLCEKLVEMLQPLEDDPEVIREFTEASGLSVFMTANTKKDVLDIMNNISNAFLGQIQNLKNLKLYLSYIIPQTSTIIDLSAKIDHVLNDKILEFDPDYLNYQAVRFKKYYSRFYQECVNLFQNNYHNYQQNKPIRLFFTSATNPVTLLNPLSAMTPRFFPPRPDRPNPAQVVSEKPTMHLNAS